MQRVRLSSTQKRRVRKMLGYSACLVCGSTRVLEIAHKLPHAKVSNNDLVNLMLLCPNHHALYDRCELTEKEAKRLEFALQIVGVDWKEHTCPTKES